MPQANEVCPNCGEFVATLSVDLGWCNKCSKKARSAVEAFLLNNADHIEHYMLKGQSLYQAIDSMRHEVQQHKTCPACGGVIKRGGRHSVFCRKTPQCRRLVRRYVYLYEKKGYTKPEALAEVLATINGSE